MEILLTERDELNEVINCKDLTNLEKNLADHIITLYIHTHTKGERVRSPRWTSHSTRSMRLSAVLTLSLFFFAILHLHVSFKIDQARLVDCLRGDARICGAVVTRHWSKKFLSFRSNPIQILLRNFIFPSRSIQNFRNIINSAKPF